MNNSHFKLPRLYIDALLAEGDPVGLSAEQAHYFRTVLRRQDGDEIRMFNGRDGEWVCRLGEMGKKGGVAVPQDQIRAQPEATRGVHLYFAPIKKTRMEWMIEKAVELGATDLHPVITQNTEVREINAERTRQQIIEAAEQCERMDVPVLHEAVKFTQLPDSVPPGVKFLAAVERVEAVSIGHAITGRENVAILIGPEGGFSVEETASMRKQDRWIAVSLGPRILRAETAAVAALSVIMLSDQSVPR